MTGVIIGRFMPPHIGHQYLIDFAWTLVDTLYVFVCTLESEPIPGDLRFGWVRRLAPEARVIHITDEIPEARRDAEGATEIWAASIRGAVDEPIDYVFASEQYGFELALALEARFFPVDPDRRNIPVSASLIRRDPYAHWRFLPAVVRPFYVRHLVLIDETRLSRSLADEFQTVVAHPYREFWRLTWNEYGGRHPADALEEEQIERGEYATIEALSRQANMILIHDIRNAEDLARIPSIDLIIARHTYVETIQAFFDSPAGAGRSVPLILQPEPVRAEEIRRLLLEVYEAN